MTPLELAPRILAGTPRWVWAVLLLLVVLGGRRLRPRRTHLAAAAIAPTAFFIWSLLGAVAATRVAGAGSVASVWAGAVAFGVLTVRIHRGPRPVRLEGGVFNFPATAVPLLLYMVIIWTRYALGVWAVLDPSLAPALGLIAVSISAATAGRFVADFTPLLRETLAGARAQRLQA